MTKILIVDDLFDNIITLKAVLNDCFDAIKVLTANNGLAAVQMANAEQPDVILLDVLMPDMDGYEVCRLLKQEDQTKDIPIVFVTALKETKQNRIKALKAGVDGFLTKPLDETELKAQVNAMLKLKEANDSKVKEKEKLEDLVKERTQVLERELEIRRQTEEELKRAEGSWSVTFNAMNEGLIVVDKAQIIKNCNQAFERIIGRKKAEIIGHNSQELIHGANDANVNICPFDLMMQTRKREMSELKIHGIAYELYVDPIFTTENALDGAVIILKDVSESIAVKEEIKKERQLLRTLIDNLPSAIYVKDKQGRKIIANIADLENIGALSPNEVIGHTDLEIFSGEIGERGYIDDMRVIRSSTPIIDREERFESINGEARWLLTSKLPLVNTSGEVSGLVGIGHDITHQKQLIKELEIAKNKAEESDRLKSAFLANMSHEIRTPMNGILGFTDLLKDDDIEPGRRKMYISNIQKSGYRMLNTVNDLIEISKIEVGEVSIQTREFDLHSTLVDICEFFRSEAEDKGLRLQCVIPDKNEQLLIKSDVSKLESIVTNLVKNAIKYSEQGSIEFSYEIKNDNFEFYCKDTGIGIPEDRINAVFNRFEQADIEDRLALQGSGLGLAITKAYVEMLGGTIWVESEYGKGSIFYFTLPTSVMLSSRLTTTNNVNNKIQKTMNEQKKRILIVDDDLTSLTFLEIILGSYAKELYKAVNGQEAVDICKEKKPDIIFMDLKMPVMTGYEATKQIRLFDKDVPIIAQSAYALGGDRELALEAGCTDYVTKPIMESKLLEFLK